MNAITATLPQSTNGAGALQAKALRAGQEFESVLLNTILGSLEHSFSHLPGGHEASSARTYDGMAMQALTSELSRGRGIGLSGFVSHWLICKKNTG